MKFFVQLIPFFVSGLVCYSVFPFVAATAADTEEDVGASSRKLQQQQQQQESNGSSFSSLVDKWAIPVPTIALITNDDGELIDDEPQIIFLKYGVTVAPNDADADTDRIISATLWSKECQSGGGTVKDDETTSNNNNNGLTLTLSTLLDENENVNKYYSVVDIALEDPNLIVNDSDLYSVISSDDNGDGNTTSTTTTTGSIDFCVRYALSATSTEAEVMEVNYVESIVSIIVSSTTSDDDIDSDGALFEFEIEDVTVATKTLLASFDYDRYTAEAASASASGQQEEGAATTKQQSGTGAVAVADAVAVHKDYTIEAYLCPGGGDNTRIIRSFSQGALVTFCVQPDAASRADGIVIKSIDSFTWIRQELTVGMGVGGQQQIVALDTIRQQAVKNGAAYDMLTAYDGCDDDAAAANDAPTFCSFSSLLKADFYASKGKVTGKGSALLEFTGATATTEAEPE